MPRRQSQIQMEMAARRRGGRSYGTVFPGRKKANRVKDRSVSSRVAFAYRLPRRVIIIRDKRRLSQRSWVCRGFKFLLLAVAEKCVTGIIMNHESILGMSCPSAVCTLCCVKTKQWKKEQVWPFSGFCTADSQNDSGRQQLYSNS